MNRTANKHLGAAWGGTPWGVKDPVQLNFGVEVYYSSGNTHFRKVRKVVFSSKFEGHRKSDFYPILDSETLGRSSKHSSKGQLGGGQVSMEVGKR